MRSSTSSQRMQVFYVNIGGGEPTVRRDFWELLDYATATRRGGEVLHQRLADHRRRSRRGSRPATTSTSRSRSTAPPRRSTTPSADPAPTRPRSPRWSTSRRRASAASRSRSSSPARTPASSTTSRRSPTATARSCASRACARRAAGPTSGTSCTRPPQQQRQLYDWLLAHGEDVLTGDSFFHLAAFGESLPGPQPLRRGPRRLPDRSGRRRLRLPVRDPRRVPGRERPQARGLRARLARTPSCSASCASRSPAARARAAASTTACRGGCMAAKFFTGLPLDGPDPECVLGHGEAAPRRSRRRPGAATLRRPLDPGGDSLWPALATGSSRSPRRKRRAQKRLPRSVYLGAAAPGRRVASRSPTTTSAFAELGLVPRIATGISGEREQATDRARPAGLDAGADLADRRPGRAPGRRDRGGARRRGARAPRWGSARSRASRSRRWSRPTRETFFQIYWMGARERMEAIMERARAAGAKGLIVTLDWTLRPPPRLGQPRDPREARPAHQMPARARRRSPGRGGCSATCAAAGSPTLTVPNLAPPGRGGADLLRRLRRVDRDPAADLGGHRLAARGVGRAVRRQGRDAPRRRPPRGRRSAPTRSRSPTTAATTSTARRRRSARCRRSSTQSAARSRSCSTAGFAAAPTSSRHSRSVPAR